MNRGDAAIQLNIIISNAKTKSLVINKKSIRYKIIINGISIEQVIEMKRRGITSFNQRAVENEVTNQVLKANKIALS